MITGPEICNEDKNNAGQNQILELGKVSEIARSALKSLISESKPAIPPYYEHAFYKKAEEMGETELISQISAALPVGQKVALMVESVAVIIANLSSEIETYKSGIDQHSGQIEKKQDLLQQMLPQQAWLLLKNHLDDLQQANRQMRTRLEITENKLSEQEKSVVRLQRENRRDPLTGTMNRLAMEEDLANEFSRAQRQRRSFGLIMADIDHFKMINDTYGHAVGDEVLKAFVVILRKTAPDEAVIYRYGGEEFLILLPEADGESVHGTAELMRKAIAANVLKHRENASIKVRITASFGVTISSSDDDSSYREVIKRADQALYEAKNSGRNRVMAALNV